MQLKIKRTIPAAVVIVAVLLFSNGASAAGSNLHGLFSIDHNLEIDGGDVSADCPAGSVCQKLPGSGSGLLVRSVTNTSTGISYLQSIIAETLPGGGLFANEQDLRQGFQGNQGNPNITQKMIIEDVAEGFSANHTLMDAVPGVNENGGLYYVMNQTMDMGNGAIAKTRIRGLITNSNGGVNSTAGFLVSARGRSVYVDQLGGPNEREMGDFIFRSDRTPLSATNQLLDNTIESVSTYNAGTYVGAVFMNQSVTGIDNDFGFLKYGTGISLNTTSGIWTAPLVSLDVLSANPAANQVSLDPFDAYGTWGAGTPAEIIFGPFGDTSDFIAPLF